MYYKQINKHWYGISQNIIFSHGSTLSEAITNTLKDRTTTKGIVIY